MGVAQAHLRSGRCFRHWGVDNTFDGSDNDCEGVGDYPEGTVLELSIIEDDEMDEAGRAETKKRLPRDAIGEFVEKLVRAVLLNLV